MSAEEARIQKALTLLEYQELEGKMFGLQREAGYFAGGLEQFTKAMRPPDRTDARGPLAVAPIDLPALEKSRAALDYGKALQLASDLNAAIDALAEAYRKKAVFGLL